MGSPGTIRSITFTNIDGPTPPSVENPKVIWPPIFTECSEIDGICHDIFFEEPLPTTDQQRLYT
ncbi:MAG: hypothetical protein Harvfovirus27_2 [Harvfovirus sp.]|uniref:Uncharacterized protein n=1 Tax=Harvfovirus sp. TaxID=2487768 RepID=A0A3G5A664_9VIRU|nr:MAG: hypothetical protein Harvfovirus27_2 [Harvfovirus sp.]